MKKYVQYGCGLSAPKEWVNFDTSPTLKIQKIPLIGSMIKSRLNASFPSNVKFGNIIKGLPVDDNSCDGLYCSHILEHLSYEDFIIALKNSHKILKSGGLFRLVMPDLENLVNNYIENKKSGNSQASVKFIKDSFMGMENRPKGLKGIMTAFLGNSKHLWLWDKDATVAELEKAGFKNIRPCKFNDSKDFMFELVEDLDRFKGSIALEMTK